MTKNEEYRDDGFGMTRSALGIHGGNVININTHDQTVGVRGYEYLSMSEYKGLKEATWDECSIPPSVQVKAKMLNEWLSKLNVILISSDEMQTVEAAEEIHDQVYALAYGD